MNNYFLKVSSKSFCKKRMGINKQMLMDLYRKRTAELELMTDNPLLEEAFHLQGYLYHNSLFNSLSKFCLTI
jgi:hypothetical protein